MNGVYLYCMKRFFAVMTAVMLCLSAGSAAFASSAPEVRSEIRDEILKETSPSPEPLPPFPESPHDVHVREEDGGTFVSRPLDINQGGTRLVPFKYTADLSVYEDPSIRVEYHWVNGRADWGVVYYFADIVIKEPTQMRTALATGSDYFRHTYKKAVRHIAGKLNAVVAINGDFFGGYSGKAFVLRQGTVYRDTVDPNLDMLLVDEEGDFHVITADQDLASIDKTTIDGKKVINAFQFGPALVVDGQPVEDEKLVDRAHSPRDAQPDMANQRMGIMQLGKLHYMVLTCAHYGLTLPRFRDLAMYVSNYQASTIYTLDGGNSSQMIFLGRKKNNTDTNPDTAKDKEGERPVTDIIYFASSWFTR